MPRLTDLRTVGSADARKLNDFGIRTAERLLRIACSRTGRIDLARETGIPEASLLRWVYLADLMRIRGIGQEYGELLSEAGVARIADLRDRQPDRLHLTLIRLNQTRRRVRRLPPREEVRRWIDQARTIKPLVAV